MASKQPSIISYLKCDPKRADDGCWVSREAAAVLAGTLALELV
jgi:hypothetical protein